MSAARDELPAVEQGAVKRTGASLIDGFDLHRVGVAIDKRIDQRTWYEFGKLLQQIEYAREWVIADWLAFGEHKYGDKIYHTAARLLGKSPRTWEDYAYIARNVRVSERSEILPTLVHKPVARFSDKPALQRKLIVLAEEHGLSKRIFELVIELHLAKKPYAHLLNESISPVERARLKAQKERQRVLKNGRRDDGDVWIQYAREQASAWRDLTKELEAASSANRKERSSYRRARTSGVVARRSAATPAARALT